MTQSRLIEIVQRIRASGIPSHFEADHMRLLIQVWRLVAEGQPVSTEHIEKVASEQDLPTEAALSFINQLSEFDDDGNIIGIFGLSQRDHPHRFRVDGKTFSTWCAWDALFLPSMLKKTAQVESNCPATKETVHVTVTPDRIKSVEPAGAVVSIILPDSQKNALESVEAVWRAFCCHVHFFGSAEAAKRWFAGKDDEIALLSIEEGFHLGHLAFKEILQFV
ncbi:MAG: organomercurial lyase [bacterium]